MEAAFAAGLHFSGVQIWSVHSAEINLHVYSVRKEAPKIQLVFQSDH